VSVARRQTRGSPAVGLLGCLLAWMPAAGQEMEPRSYSPSPVGMNFAGVSYVHSSGGVAVDPTLPIENIDADLESAVLGASRTVPLAGRTASVALVLPYVWGHVSGDVFEERRTVRRQGFADARLRLAVNLVGGPALNPAEFAARKPGTSIGASLAVVVPSGEYKSEKLVNLGSNRWAFKPELGLYQPFGPWAFELSAGSWFFTDNDNFFGTSNREQDPLLTAQLHVSYTFRPRLWIAASGTWYGGGSTTVDGVAKADRQDNTRIGATLSIPVTGGLSVKLGLTDGVTTRIGTDFTTFALAWQYAWQSGPASRRGSLEPRGEGVAGGGSL
jgi:hypothetical protein